MAQTVVGFFDNASEAHNAVQQLISNGFSRNNIDVTVGSNPSNSSYTTNTDTDREQESGISRFFRSLFGDDDDEAEKYTRVGQRSGSIVTVHAQSSDEAERAADLLDDYGAINVNERASQYGYTSSRNVQDSDVSGRTYSDNERDVSIPKIEEELQVGKRTVETGGVRVRSRIVERPVEETIRLREEQVRVERNPVDRPVTDKDLSNFEEKEIELIERAEVPVVNKEARVVEEINISKEVSDRDETIRDTVRNTEIDIENVDRSDVRDRIDNDENRNSSTKDY